MKLTYEEFLSGVNMPTTLSGEELKRSMYSMWKDGYEYKESDNEHPDVSQHEQEFMAFVKLYPGTKRGWKRECDNFIKKYKKEGAWQKILPTLIPILEKQIKHKAYLAMQGQFIPMWPNLSTYLNQGRWEEVIPEAPKAVVPEEKKEKVRKFVTIPSRPEDDR